MSVEFSYDKLCNISMLGRSSQFLVMSIFLWAPLDLTPASVNVIYCNLEARWPLSYKDLLRPRNFPCLPKMIFCAPLALAFANCAIAAR